MSTAYILMAFLSVWISIEVLFYTSTRLAISEPSQTHYKRFIWPVRSLALILLIFAFLVVNLSKQLDFVDLIFICTF